MAPVVVKIIIAALALVIGALIGYIYRKNHIVETDKSEVED